MPVTVQSTLFRGISAKLDEFLNNSAARAGNLTAANRFLKDFSVDHFIELMKIAYAAVAQAEEVKGDSVFCSETPKLAKVYEMPLCANCECNRLSLRLACPGCGHAVSGTTGFFQQFMTHTWDTYKQQMQQLLNNECSFSLESRNPSQERNTRRCTMHSYLCRQKSQLHLYSKSHLSWPSSTDSKSGGAAFPLILKKSPTCSYT